MREVWQQPVRPTITIRVSGNLFVGHLSYLDKLVLTASECELWPLLNLSELKDVDRAAVLYFANGEGQTFGLVYCPEFVQEWIEEERNKKAA